MAGLRLGIGAGVTLALENVGSQPLEVLSHVMAAGERHYDWFTVIVGEREFKLQADRNRSGFVRVTLAPGESLRHEIDLAAWAARQGVSLTTGALRARYEVEGDPTAWNGRLTAP